MISAEDALQYARQGTNYAPQTFTPETPAPVSKPSFLKTAARVGLAGLGKVGEVLNKPSEWTEKILTGGSTYEDRYKVPKLAGTALRIVLDPLNFISIGSSGVAKVGLKSLTKPALRHIGQEGLEQLGKFATKEGAITLSKTAGKELAQLEAKYGRKAAEIAMLNRVAKGEDLVAKSGLKVGLPFTNIEKTYKLPGVQKLMPSVISKIPQPVRETVSNVGMKARRAFEYPLNRAPAQAGDIVDAASAVKQKFFEQGDRFIANYQKAPQELKTIVDDVLRGAVKITNHENPMVKEAIEVRKSIDSLGKRAVELGLLSRETYEKGQGTYLPRLYDVFLQRSDDVIKGSPEAKRIATDEFARVRRRTDTQIMADLKAGKISEQQAQAEINVLNRFKEAGGEVTNPAFLASKALQNLGGLISKTEEFKQLRKFGKSAEQLAEDVVQGVADVKLPKGIKGNQRSEIARHTLDIFERAAAEGQPMTEKLAEKLGARNLINTSSEVTSRGQKLLRLPNSASLGELSGMYVPEGIHTFLTEGSGRFLSSEAGKWMMRLSAPFKFKELKTVWSPGSQVRNVLSNQILGFLQDPGSFKHFREAINVVKDHSNPVFKEMEKVGLFSGKFFGEEVSRFYQNIPLADSDSVSFFTKIVNSVGNFHNKLGDTRDFFENMAKVQQYLRARELGASAQEAKKIAETALFAYQKVGPAVRIIRSSAVPFLTFTIKAVPFVARQGIKHPGRLAVFPKAEREFVNIFGLNEEEQKYLPDWMKGMIPLPMKDENGNTLYFNPKYIYPWGQTMNDFEPLPGLPVIGQGGQLPGGVSMSPTISEFISQVTGRDLFTGEEFVRESQTPDEQVRARLERVGKTFSPGATSGFIPFLPGATSTTESQKERGLGLTALGAATGMQVQPFNMARGIESKQKRIQAIKRQTSTEVNNALRSGKSLDEINRIRQRGLERIIELQSE